MSQKIRQEEILDILKKQGYVTVRYLVSVLQYSTATINRDLNAMQRLGLVKRSYGGVEAVLSHRLPPFVQRQFYHKKEKRRIAEEAVGQIQNGDTVFLDGSTTVQYMLPFLLSKKDLTVITNSLQIAMSLSETDFEVICLGGVLVERPCVLDGDSTAENAMRYCPDQMFFSTNAITADGMVTGAHYLLYRVMLKNSKHAWMLTDKTKVVDRLETVLCDFSALTGVIADFDFSEQTKRSFPDVRFICTGEDQSLE